jgi:NAD-dependent deacetylase
VWDWYAWRRELVAKAQPNAAHVALARLEERVPQFTLVTQNVDGLHARAGSRRLIELHGNIARVKCSRDGRVVDAWRDDDASVPPRCPHCGAFLRPDVVWFEEMLPADALSAAEDAARAAELLLVVGTSAEVYPAAALPALARAAGARIVEINPAPTPVSAFADDRLRGPAGEVLPALVAAAWP